MSCEIIKVYDKFTDVPIEKRISVSKIKDANCPYKYFKNHIEDPKENPPFVSIEMGVGRFFHSQVETLFKKIGSENRKIKETDVLDVDGLTDEFEMAFLWNGQLRKPYGFARASSFDYFKDRLIKITNNFNRHALPNLIGQKVVNTEGELQIKTIDFVIRGKYDLITQDEADCFILWDWKTGRAPSPNFYDDFLLQKMQLGIYATWMRCHYGMDRVISNAVFLREGVDILQEVVGLNTSDQVIDFISDKYKELKDLTDYTPMPNNLCPWCSWKSKCGYE